MDPASAKLIGAGLAAIGTGAAAIGVGNLFGQFLQGALLLGVHRQELAAQVGVVTILLDLVAGLRDRAV